MSLPIIPIPSDRPIMAVPIFQSPFFRQLRSTNAIANLNKKQSFNLNDKTFQIQGFFPPILVHTFENTDPLKSELFF